MSANHRCTFDECIREAFREKTMFKIMVLFERLDVFVMQF